MAILKIRDADGNIQEILAIKGDKGEQGVQGIQGIQGEKGEKGDTGAQGVQGEKGDKGDTGATGADGKDGIDGKDYVLTEADKQEIAEMVIQTANIAYVGTGTPASTLGNDGDIYIVTE